MKRTESININTRINNFRSDCLNVLSDINSDSGIMEVGRGVRGIQRFAVPILQSIRKDIHNLSSEYRPEAIGKEQKELYSNLKDAINVVKNATRDMVSEYRETETKKVEKMISTPPTDNQIALLSSLNMRKNISPAELELVAKTVASNYQATRILSDIAASQGCYLSMPIRSVDEINDAIEKTCSYLNDAIDYIDTPYREITPSKKFFFAVDTDHNENIGDPHFTAQAQILDSSPELRAIKANKTGLNAAERTKIDYYMNSVKNTDITTEDGKKKVMSQIQKTINEHPEMLPLMRMSEYADETKSIEKMRATTVDKNDKSLRRYDRTETLINYINDATKGLEGSERSNKISNILACIPQQQRYAYDYYNTYGEIVNPAQSTASNSDSQSEEAVE
jgi:hypothetical protein